MNLKLVVASMSILGLVSCPVFAADQGQSDNSQPQPKHKHHHKHHQKVKHVVKHEKHEKDDDDDRMDERNEHSVYKGMGPAPITCTINESTLVLTDVTQNVGRALPNPCYPGWFNRISLSGGVNVDLGKWGNRNGNFMGENYQRLSLNDAYISISAVVNDWTTAFASISYNTATINDPIDAIVGTHVAEFDAAYDNNITSGSTHTLQLEQAYATFGNFAVSPIFVQVGKQFQDFGRYQIHPITEPFTEVMSKTLATSAKLGFLASGFNGSVYVFDDPIPKTGQSKKPTNYGAALGYEQPGTCSNCAGTIGWDIGAAYLYNLVGVNDIAFNVNQFNVAAGNGIGYNTRVGGAAAYLDIIPGPFTVSLRYVTALQRFNILDLPKNGTATDANGVLTSTTGAKPWSAGIQLGYGFDMFCGVPQYLYVGYQVSRQAAGLLLPKNRWVAGYNIDVWRNTNFGIEWDHDTAYSTSNGGSGNNTNLVSLRAGVKFA